MSWSWFVTKDVGVEELSPVSRSGTPRFRSVQRILSFTDVDRDRWANLIHQQPLLIWAVALALGVVSDAWLRQLPVAVWGGLGGLCLLILATVGMRRTVGKTTANKTRGTLAALAGVILVFVIGAMDHRWQDQRYQTAELMNYVGPSPKPAIVEGIIVGSVRVRQHPLVDQQKIRRRSPWQTLIELEVQRFRVGTAMVPLDGSVQVTVDGLMDRLLPGDSLRVHGMIRGSAAATNPGGNNWAAIDRQRGIHGRISVRDVEQILVLKSGGSTDKVTRLIAGLARRAREILLERLDDRAGPLAVAMVIGQRDFVDRQTRDRLLVTGTAHLLSVSGMHLAIVAWIASTLGLLLRLSLTSRVVFVLSVCLFYAALTGGRPPVVRAAILVSVFMIALWFRRPSQPLNTLSLAAILLIGFRPESLFGIGVQLSFLAVGTLLIAGGRVGKQARTRAVDEAIKLERRLEVLVDSVRPRWWRLIRGGLRKLGGAVWMSLCVTAISGPLVWYHFCVVSPISVLANVVLMPLLTVALTLGIATMITAVVHSALAVVPALGCQWTIESMDKLISLAASIPGGHAWLPPPSGVWVAVYYIGVIATLCLPQKVPSWRWRYGWIATWFLVTLVGASRPSSIDRETFEVTFVDVGHGTCVILRNENQVWLYDCGRLGNEAGSSRGIDQTLWSMGVTHLDGIILSHADADHFNALPGIIRRFTVGQIVTPPGMLAEPEHALIPIRDAIHRAGVEIRECSAGDQISLGDDTMHVLHPPARRIGGSDNANSLVIQMDHHGTSVVLPGDLEPPGTDCLVDFPRPKAGGVLMAPHHGSLRMEADKVLHWMRPGQTIVSGGRLARRPEVTQMLSARGSQVWVTAIDGAIRVLIGPDGTIKMASWLDGGW